MEVQTMPLSEEIRWRKIRMGLVIFALLLPILLSVVLQVQVKPSDYSGARAALEAGFQGDGFFWATQGAGDPTMYLADIGEAIPLMHLYDLAYLAGGVLFLFLCIENSALAIGSLLAFFPSFSCAPLHRIGSIHRAGSSL